MIDRDAGVLAIRDAGSPFPYPELDDDPDMPRLARAGRHVAAPKRYLRDIGVEVRARRSCRRPRPAGRGRQRLGQAGRRLDRPVASATSRRPGTPTCWPRRSTAAHAAGARVAVHTFAEESVAALVRAGVDSVEHGTGLSDEDIDEMARRGTALVPTMINIETFGDIAEQAQAQVPRVRRPHARAARPVSRPWCAPAYEAGVPIYVGTDAGGGIEHGLAAEEMLLLHAGRHVRRRRAARPASWGRAAWLGFPGLVEGGLADLVVYDADPRVDLRVLRRLRADRPARPRHPLT